MTSVRSLVVFHLGKSFAHYVPLWIQLLRACHLYGSVLFVPNVDYEVTVRQETRESPEGEPLDYLGGSADLLRVPLSEDEPC